MQCLRLRELGKQGVAPALEPGVLAEGEASGVAQEDHPQKMYKKVFVLPCNSPTTRETKKLWVGSEGLITKSSAQGHLQAQPEEGCCDPEA